VNVIADAALQLAGHVNGTTFGSVKEECIGLAALVDARNSGRRASLDEPQAAAEVSRLTTEHEGRFGDTSQGALHFDQAKADRALDRALNPLPARPVQQAPMPNPVEQLLIDEYTATADEMQGPPLRVQYGSAEAGLPDSERELAATQSGAIPAHIMARHPGGVAGVSAFTALVALAAQEVSARRGLGGPAPDVDEITGRNEDYFGLARSQYHGGAGQHEVSSATRAHTDELQFEPAERIDPEAAIKRLMKENPDLFVQTRPGDPTRGEFANDAGNQVVRPKSPAQRARERRAARPGRTGPGY
jgi:hypothetical protein